MRVFPHFAWLAGAIVAGLLLSSPAPAQPATAATVGALSAPNRTAQLIAGAKREGVISLYSSTALEDITPLIDAFEKRYGVDVRIWRAGSSDILQRSLTEARAGRADVDVIETAMVEMHALWREGLFQPVTSPVFAELMPAARPPGAPFAGSRVWIYNLAYNTRLVRAADVPKRYEDLLDPKWKGRIGIEATDSNWFMALTTAMGEAKGLQLFRDVSARNGFSVRRGHTLLTSLIVSGEVPLALNVFRHEVLSLQQAKAPIEAVNLSPSIADMAAAGVLKRAPHPYAAMLFVDFLLSDGQKIWADMNRVPTNLKYQRLPPGLQLTFIDAQRFVRESARWDGLFREILTRR